VARAPRLAAITEAKLARSHIREGLDFSRTVNAHNKSGLQLRGFASCGAILSMM